MGARENLQRLADKKAQEISELERQIDMAKVYLQAIQDSMKALPRETLLAASGEESADLRAGTLLARTRDAIKSHGCPMHISSILNAIGVENTKSARVSLVGSLGGYVRKGIVFTRPRPNTFGLVGMKPAIMTLDEGMQKDDLPENFGEVTEGN